MCKHFEQISIVSIKLVKYIPKRNSLYIKTKVGIQLFFDGINKVVYSISSITLVLTYFSIPTYNIHLTAVKGK